MSPYMSSAVLQIRYDLCLMLPRRSTGWETVTIYTWHSSVSRIVYTGRISSHSLTLIHIRLYRWMKTIYQLIVCIRVF